MKLIQRGLFSEREINDLLKAWLAISLAFGIVLNRGFSLGLEFANKFILSALTVGIAFLLHELGHRTVARRFGCFAEFRSFDMMLVLAVIMSFFGFILAAPGAVMISGPVGRTRNGKISAAGPLVNLVLALIFFIIALTLHPAGLLKGIIQYGFLINTWLALFNLLPIGIFDGRKILNWNKPVYGIMVAIALCFMFLQGIVM